MTIDPSLLRATGEALYGPRWQTELARAIRVSDRTVRRWLAGTITIPPGVARDLEALCNTRIDEIRDAADRLQGRAAR